MGARSQIRIGVLSVFGTLLAIPTLLWAGIWIVGFIDRFGEKCNFGSINDVEYESISSRASAQPWTVWPGLSNGVFFASSGNNKVVSSSCTLESCLDPIHQAIASWHPLTPSCAASAPNTSRLRNCPTRAELTPVRIFISHYLPQVRFAPACFFCLVWWYTTIQIIFSHELATDRYEFQAVNVLHAQLKYNPAKEGARNIPWGSCPALRR